MRKSFVIVSCFLISSVALAAGDEGVKLGQGIIVPSVGFTEEALGVRPPPEARVIKFTYVRKGESCIKALARIGERVTTQQCVAAAHRAGIDVLWYRPDLKGSATYIVNLHPDDKVGVYQEGKMKKLIIFYRDMSQGMSFPLLRN